MNDQKPTSEKIIHFEPQINDVVMKIKMERTSLVDDMENYYRIYRHKNPCSEWKKNKWCEHYVKARARKFKNRVNSHFDDVLQVRRKLIYPRHISK